MASKLSGVNFSGYPWIFRVSVGVNVQVNCIP